ncbi:[3-methyl-2-oxobutanoate dehydrogenase [lipoamide]] kinase, mitochondrial [Armadillidium vulgare]|nr:[3-methyl-2-oxobutanoate dehydrogenase [lipoamide]] kinase, mitochondrial [Armadillidium vulgare]
MSFLSRITCNSSIAKKGSLSNTSQAKAFYLTAASSERERTKTVSAYYNQPAIEAAARKKSIRLTPYVILYSGRNTDGSHLLKSAQYLQKEMTIRIARRIMDFRSLPFIVGCNPTILGVHELYIRAFNILNSFELIKTHKDEEKYSQVLRQLLDDHKDVVSRLAQGFRECRRHIKEEDENYVGVIHLGMKLKEVIERNSQFVSRMALHKYGRVPEIKLSGHVNASFPYIEMPLDYILPELLKNAVRATVENHSEGNEGEFSSLPPIRITIASNEVDFIIRISDRGGGIPHHLMQRVLCYNFTTAHDENENKRVNEDVFSNMMESCNPNPVGGPMHGFGFGLPTSRAYSQYMGGNVDIQTMQGIGTDVYLRLKHINSRSDSFRI